MCQNAYRNHIKRHTHMHKALHKITYIDSSSTLRPIGTLKFRPQASNDCRLVSFSTSQGNLVDDLTHSMHRRSPQRAAHTPAERAAALSHRQGVTTAAHTLNKTAQSAISPPIWTMTLSLWALQTIGVELRQQTTARSEANAFATKFDQSELGKPASRNTLTLVSTTHRLRHEAWSSPHG